jgi:prophage antirepressor-like protein
VRSVRKGDEILFYAKDVAVALGYRNSRKAVGDNVWNKNKVLLRELAMGNWQLPIGKYHPDTILVNEPGLYQLIFKSNLPIAETFQQ